MGQCICKDRNARPESPDDDHSYRLRSLRHIYGQRGGGSLRNNAPNQPGTSSSAVPMDNSHVLIQTLNLDIRDLILETLTVIRTLVNNDQEPPAAMFKLNLIADREPGWLSIVQTMIDIIPADNPMGPAVITLFLDESPLPTKETVCKLLLFINLSSKLALSKDRGSTWHRNCCIVLGCIAEKLAGPNSVATFKPTTLDYLLANLENTRDPSVILFSLIALEKYAQTSENKSLIARRLAEKDSSSLRCLECWIESDDYIRHQVGFCAQWALDNMFIQPDRNFSYETVDTSTINVMLNHNDVSEYLKISPNGLEARCDVSTFESVRCTFQVDSGIWFYEALIITPGIMQIGWATKHSKFLNHDGYGIGDDEYSVAYDGCRQLLWHNASSQSHSHDRWQAGDILGCLLDLDQRSVMFYLNGCPLRRPHTQVFTNARSGFFAAASFMTFQQCQFNFGHIPFRYPPTEPDANGFQSFNSHASLTEEQRIILPRHKKLELLRQFNVPENSCTLCFNNPATVTLKPCEHSGFCTQCSILLEQCPLCRGEIDERCEDRPSDSFSGGASSDISTVAPLYSKPSDQMQYTKGTNTDPDSATNTSVPSSPPDPSVMLTASYMTRPGPSSRRHYRHDNTDLETDLEGLHFSSDPSAMANVSTTRDGYASHGAAEGSLDHQDSPGAAQLRPTSADDYAGGIPLSQSPSYPSSSDFHVHLSSTPQTPTDPNAAPSQSLFPSRQWMRHPQHPE